MYQGILVISKYSYWSLYLPRRHKIRVHIVFQVLSILLITIGTAVMSHHKKVNFNTIHGILGKQMLKIETTLYTRNNLDQISYGE